jgi:hypothetical protein
MQMEVDGCLLDLSPGMAVAAEIKTGSSRVIEYLLSPLVRYRQQGCTNDNVLPGANGTKRREVKNGDGTAWSSVPWRLIPRARKPVTGR